MSDANGIDVMQEVEIDPQSSIGAQLCAARKMRKLSIEKVAQELHLDVSVIRAIENDDREKLPATIFVQGYLKSYGRLVGLPVAELIKAYSAQAGEPPPLSVIRTSSSIPVVRMRSFRLVRNVIIISMVAIMLWFAWQFLERYIDVKRESVDEQMPGRLELPPVNEGTVSDFESRN